MHKMFADCGAKELDLNVWNTSNITDVIVMFMLCSNLKKINLSNFETPNAKDVYRMFGQMFLENIDIRNFDNTHIDNDRFLYDAFLDTQGVHKLTVGPNLKNTSFPILYGNPVFDVNGHAMIAIDNIWISTSSPEKGILRTSNDMKNATRTKAITYTPKMKPLINTSTEYKIVTRTINFHLLYDQGINSIVQKATIHRQVTANDNETKTYGEWSKEYWDEYNAPNIFGAANPKPAKVDKQVVDCNTQDQTVDIYY